MGFQEIVTDKGCQQLHDSLNRAKPKLPAGVTDVDSRSLERLKGFCTKCCTGAGPQTLSSGATHFTFYGFGYGLANRFRCHNMYHPTAWWKIGMASSDQQCRDKCSAALPHLP